MVDRPLPDNESGEYHHGHDADDGLDPEEVTLIQSTVNLRDMPLDKIMIPIDKVFMIDAKEIIDTSLLYKIYKRGYSKFPIYQGDKGNVIGVISTKNMITGNEYSGRPISDSVKYSKPVYVSKDLNLLELLSIFQKEKTQLMFVIEKSLGNSLTTRRKFSSVNFFKRR